MLFRELALIPLLLPNELNGFADEDPKEEEPNDPNEAGPKEAGEKAPLRDGLLDIAAIGDRPDIALIGFENDIPDIPG